MSLLIFGLRILSYCFCYHAVLRKQWSPARFRKAYRLNIYQAAPILGRELVYFLYRAAPGMDAGRN